MIYTPRATIEDRESGVEPRAMGRPSKAPLQAAGVAKIASFTGNGYRLQGRRTPTPRAPYPPPSPLWPGSGPRSGVYLTRMIPRQRKNHIHFVTRTGPRPRDTSGACKVARGELESYTTSPGSGDRRASESYLGILSRKPIREVSSARRNRRIGVVGLRPAPYEYGYTPASNVCRDSPRSTPG